MAQLIVRKLEDEVKARLGRRAALHGHSMEEEVREILRNALKSDRTAIALGSRIAARFRRRGLDLDFAELRGQAARPAELI